MYFYKITCHFFEDNNFFNLLYSLIGQKEDFIIEEDKLELLHIIMMDQIRNIIPSEFIFKTPQSNYPVLLNIENIQENNDVSIKRW